MVKTRDRAVWWVVLVKEARRGATLPDPVNINLINISAYQLIMVVKFVCDEVE